MRNRKFGAIVVAAALLGGMLPLGVSHGDERDHEKARQALEAGDILPLSKVLSLIERDYPGQVVEVEFEREDGAWVYELKVLQAGGRMVELEIAARDGTVLKSKMRKRER